MLRIAKLFRNGHSQAVRLPAEFWFERDEVYGERDGDRAILRPKPKGWDDFFDRPVVVDDFMADRVDLPPGRAGEDDSGALKHEEGRRR